MAEYPVPENKELSEWRFDDQGLLAGPYTFNELEEYVELGYIQPETEIVHESGEKYEAYGIGLFPDFVPVKPEPVYENTEGGAPLPGWNALAGVAILSWITVKVLPLVPALRWLYSLKPYSMIIGGFAVVMIGCYTMLTGTAHDSAGKPAHRPVANRVAGLVVIIIGVYLIYGGSQFFYQEGVTK